VITIKIVRKVIRLVQVAPSTPFKMAAFRAIRSSISRFLNDSQVQRKFRENRFDLR
jgi:hypothetical protein